MRDDGRMGTAMTHERPGFLPGFLFLGAFAAGWAFLGIRPMIALLIPAALIWGLILTLRDAAARRDGLQRAAEAVFAACVHDHRPALQRRRTILTSRDDYGNEVTTRWMAELSYFYRSVVAPRLAAHGPGTEPAALSAQATETAFLAWFAAQDPVPLGLPAGRVPGAALSPLEFEHWCREQLALRGWAARTTTGSGDQGADVLAERDGTRLVIQCKLQSAPVGNKAVQEVIAARQFYRCDLAAVVTNQGFTRSAADLARSAGVALLHSSDLAGFAGAPPAAARGIAGSGSV